MSDYHCPLLFPKYSAQWMRLVALPLLFVTVAAARLFAQQDQDVTGNLTVAGTATVSSSTSSTSPSTGALVVSGGAGIGGNLNVNGTLKVTGGTSAAFLGQNPVYANQAALYLGVSTPSSANFTITSSGTDTFLNTQSSGGILAFLAGNSERARIAPTSGNLLLGTTTDSGNGRLQLVNHSGAAGGIAFGPTIPLFRSYYGSGVETLTVGHTLQIGLSPNEGNAGSVLAMHDSHVRSGDRYFSGLWNNISGGWLSLRSQGAGLELLSSESVNYPMRLGTSHWSGTAYISSPVIELNGNGGSGAFVKIFPSTASSSVSTGALVVSGGTGITGNLNVGGNIDASNLLTFKGSTSTKSTIYQDGSTNALVFQTNNGVPALTLDTAQNAKVTGSMNIGASVDVTGLLTFKGTTATKSTVYQDGSTNALIFQTNNGVPAMSIDTAQTVRVLGATASTSPTTGAMVVTGGAGIGGNLNVGGSLNVGGLLDVTNAATGQRSFFRTGSGGLDNVYLVHNNTGYSAGAGYEQLRANAGAVGADTGATGGFAIVAAAVGAPVTFGTGGYATANERMRIAGNGNVGIGTTTPLSKLAVSGGASIGANYNVVAPTNGLIVEGNMGIGLTTPGQKLAISYSSPSTITNALSINETSGSGTAGGYISFTAGGNEQAAFGGFFNAGVGSALALYTGNSHVERLRIDGNGNVGIGTSSPASALHLYSASPIIRLQDSATGGVQHTLQGAGGVLSMTADAGNAAAGSRAITFNLFQSEFARLSSTGNFGIGTTSPSAKLDVSGGANISGSLVVGGSLNTAALQIAGQSFNPLNYVLKTGDSVSGPLSAAALTATGGGVSGGSTGLAISAGGVNQNVSISPGGTGAIILNGNVGIGVTAPSSKLTIGLANATTASAPVTATRPNEYLHLGNLEAGTNSYRLIGFGYGGISSLYSPAYIGYQEMLSNSETSGDLVFGTRNSQADIQASERLRITQAGNVGIGTTNPTALLDIDSPIAGDISGGGTQPMLQISRRSVNRGLRTLNYNGTNGSFVTQYTNDFSVWNDLFAYDTNNGRIGVGTAAPLGKLDVFTGVANAVALSLARVSNSTLKAAWFSIDSSENTALSTNNGSLTFKTNHNGGSTLGTMLLDNTGKVAIGTSTSGLTAALTISNPSNSALILRNSTSVDRFKFYVGNGAAYNNDENYISNYNTNLHILGGSAGTTEIATFLSGGNVGIGTSSPASALHLYSASPTIRLQDSATGGVQHTIQGAGGLLSLTADAGNAATGSRAITFNLVNAEFARLSSNGNFGIGTPTPSAKLDVAGNSNVSGSSTISGTTTTGSLSVTTNAIIAGQTSTDTLNVGTNATIGGALSVAGQTTTQSLAVAANTTLGGNISVAGTATIAGETTTNTLTVNTNASVTGNSTVTGQTTTGTLNVTSSGLIGGTLSVAGDAIISGNVGIGTPSPMSKLHLRDAANGGNIQLNPTEGSIELASGNDGVSFVDFKGVGNLTADYRGRIVYTDGVGMEFAVGGGDSAMRIFEDGSIRVGHNVPNSARFSVRDAIEIRADDADSRLTFHDPGEFWYSMGIDRSDGGKFKIGRGGVIGDDSRGLAFDYETAYLGIGTSNPSAPLDVLAPSSSFTIANFRGQGSVNQAVTISNAIGSLNIGIADAGATNGVPYIWTPGKFMIGNNGGPVLYIDGMGANGKVGIGTTNLTNVTHALSVNGTIRAKEIIVDSDWSDYVFAADYRLAPLSEVEQHIKSHQHLPGIPSAQEVAQNGVTVGDMQAKLLAKIEELTLHMIAQDKKLSAQTERLERLEAENATLRLH